MPTMYIIDGGIVAATIAAVVFRNRWLGLVAIVLNAALAVFFGVGLTLIGRSAADDLQKAGGFPTNPQKAWEMGVQSAERVLHGQAPTYWCLVFDAGLLIVGARRSSRGRNAPT